LRKGGSLPKRTNLTLPDEPLPLSEGVLKSLREATRAMGKGSTARLVSDLLEKIANDSLYKAVLDEGLYDGPASTRLGAGDLRPRPTAATNHKTRASDERPARTQGAHLVGLPEWRPIMTQDDVLVWLSFGWFVALCGGAIWVLLLL
jgi:hypothetical protein